ncbi:diguanylate cyclase [Alcaligenes faecalis subsp. faecalis NCIB 8687]|jgi:GGDEF domain-containing protein/EAL domain-containing protein (putative c-di-GMP-specific phosphodiesterase class I)|uniref:bifunctional diguanylate cyclase/phosphodiesterase n=1 Tax=Alcaligenes sp. CHO6 TaxID=3123298 RepID=UPI000269EC81|nr:diguanylate cyclase [Alcaligenes faecalis subsp. faecalis NCIB 8687]WGQ35489.1 LapD/MoxY N-terminal periplasmic domain-containing protein [Alcaligenes faecalis]
MSLLKQLLLSVSCAILAILVGTLWFSVDSARQYLSSQLQAQAESAATSLALTLSQPSNQDPVTQELLIAALYDTGQFERIRFSDTANAVLVERSTQQETQVSTSSPAWFANSLPIEVPVALAHVSNGWNQIGTVEVKPADEYARASLWKSFVRVTLLVLGAGIAWGVFVLMVMAWLRRALRDHVQFELQQMDQSDSAPGRKKVRLIPELEEVAHTLSTVQKRIRVSSQEQNARIEQLQLELNCDPVTGLANRKYFVNLFRQVLQQEQGGHVLLFRQRDLLPLNTSLSRDAVDAWLKLVTQRCAELLRENGMDVGDLARLNGSDFIVLLKGQTGPQVMGFAQELRTALQELRQPLPDGSLCRWSMAMTNYEAHDSLSAVMTRLDNALMRAEGAGHQEVEYRPSEGGHHEAGSSIGEQEWHSRIERGLEQGRIELSVKPGVEVWGQAGQIYDATLNLLPEQPGQASLPAYLFIPVAVRLGLSAQCDLRTMQLASDWLATHEGSLSVRVSWASVVKPDFAQQAADVLSKTGDKAQRLIIELDAYCLSEHDAETVAFVDKLRPLGVQFGLRRVLEQPESILWLHMMALKYIVLDDERAQTLQAEVGGRHLLMAFLQSLQELGIGLRRVTRASNSAQLDELLRENAVLPRP